MNAAAPIAPWPVWQVIAGGALLGVAYTLSPMTVLVLPSLALLVHATGRPLGSREREWFYALMIMAIVARVAVIAALFLSADAAEPFATFFGDEALFKTRSIWLRNIGLGVPISAADFGYAVEETGKSSYLFVLAFVAAVVGDLPYGVHLLNTALYMMGVCIMYRLVRSSYGRMVALGGAAVLLFLPSLFFWSISALKEPLYALFAALELSCALYLARGRQWPLRLGALVAIVVLAVLLEGLRKGGLIVAGVGTLGAIAGAVAWKRPRLAVAALLALPLIGVAALQVPAVHDRAMGVVSDAAIYHVGHVFTPGYSYQTLDPRFYVDPADIRRMPEGDAVRFVATSLASYVMQPLPWTIESRSMLAFLPEHVLWLALVALVPAGVLAGVRHDAVLTAALVAHAFAVMFIVALTSGNVGTLIRHRGLVLPYAVWLSMLGGYHLLRQMIPSTLATHQASRGTDHGGR